MACMKKLLLLLVAARASCESYVVYHPQAHTNPPPARALSCAVLQHTVAETAALGRFVWVFGGLDTSLGALNDLWRLDLQTNTWSEQTATGVAPVARRGASLVLSEQRTAYLFGGETNARAKLNDLFALRIGGGTGSAPAWEDISANVTGTPPAARTEHTASVINLLAAPSQPLGMLLFGGASAAGVALADLHSFDFATLRWSPLSPSGVVPQARKGHTASVLLNSLLAIFGGSNQDVPVFFADVHIYDVARNSWIQPAVSTPSPQPDGRDGHSMVAIEDTVYIFGGVNARGEKLADLWAFNAYAAVSGQLRWTQPTPMSAAPTPRWGHIALASLGAMTVLGGTGAGDALLTDAWLMSAGCSGELALSAARGVFSDGDGPYRNGLDCRWTITPALPHTNVRVTLTALGLVDNHDRVEIYDGDALTAPLLASYTGSSIPPAITGTGSSLLVRLTTDAAGDNGEGFQAAYQAVCSAGYTWDTVSASCAPCPAGMASSLAGAMRCEPCPVGFYNAQPGATQCTQCPAFATTSQPGGYVLRACTCQAGYFGWNNECRICPEGAACPGDRLVSARPGWCETSNATTAVPTFAHCCQPHLCPGGLNAACDASIGLVGEAECSVQRISWDSLHLVTLTTGTWVTFCLIIALALLICFCTGLSLGVRRAARRQIDSLVVPMPAQMPKPPPTSDSAAGFSVPFEKTPVEPMRAEPADAAPPPPQPERPALTPEAGALPAPGKFYGGSDEPARAVASAEYQAMMAGAPPAVQYNPMFGGGGQVSGDEDVMEISLDDANAIGSGAPPPSLFAATMMRAPEVSVGPDPALSPGEDEAADGEGGMEEESTPISKGKKGKKGKKKAEEEGDEAGEGGEDEAEDTPKKGKKKAGKKKNTTSEDDVSVDGSADGDGKKKKKKKKAAAE